MKASAAVATSPIRDRFLGDHQRLEVLLEQVLDAFAANDRQGMSRLWTEFDSGLLAHLEAEERNLIPTLLRACPRDARVVIQEHRHILARMTELGTAGRSAPRSIGLRA